MVVMAKTQKWKWDDKPHFVNSYEVSSDSLEIECQEGLTFAWLEEIAEAFGTKHIDVRTETRSGGYCETCAYEYSVAILDVQKVTKWP